jgi:hypothetical protein
MSVVNAMQELVGVVLQFLNFVWPINQSRTVIAKHSNVDGTSWGSFDGGSRDWALPCFARASRWTPSCICSTAACSAD